MRAMSRLVCAIAALVLLGACSNRSPATNTGSPFSRQGDATGQLADTSTNDVQTSAGADSVAKSDVSPVAADSMDGGSSSSPSDTQTVGDSVFKADTQAGASADTTAVHTDSANGDSTSAAPDTEDWDTEALDTKALDTEALADTQAGVDSHADTQTDTVADTQADTVVDAPNDAAVADTAKPLPNKPPVFASQPPPPFKIAQKLGGNFKPDQVFLSSSRTDQIRVYEAPKLKFLQAFTHPAFSSVKSTSYKYGPNGTAFNSRGNLVVAAWKVFVEFSGYGVAWKTYPKKHVEANENVTFDPVGNMYTTTATGGSDKLNQYRAKDYAFKLLIPMPKGAGQLTGITFGRYGGLFVASQTDNKIHFAVPNADFTKFTWTKHYSGGNPMNFEGIQINSTDELVAAGGDLVRYDLATGKKLGVFDAKNDKFPVPLRVDNLGRIYTADYEDGSGVSAADVFVFSPVGKLLHTINDKGLRGPFGLAISGTVLVGDPPVSWSYKVLAVDLNGDKLTYKLLNGPKGMTIDAQTGELKWAVTSFEIGKYSVTIEVSDGKGGTATQTFVLEIASK